MFGFTNSEVESNTIGTIESFMYIQVFNSKNIIYKNLYCSSNDQMTQTQHRNISLLTIDLGSLNAFLGVFSECVL